MTYIFYFTALIANYFASWRRKQSMIILLFTLCVILLLWVGNTDGPDIANYHIHFNTSGWRIFKYSFYQFLYNYPIFFFRELGFSFYQYRFAGTLFSWMILLFVLVKLRTNIHLVFFTYLCVEFFMEGIQYRNFLAVPFLMLGILILIKKLPFSKILFLITIGLAASIHSSFLAYAILLLIPRDTTTKVPLLWLHGLGALGILLFFFLFRSQLNIFINLLISFDDKRGLQYTQQITRLGILVPVFLQALAIYIVNFVRLNLLKIHSSVSQTLNADIQTVSTILWVDIIASYLLSLCIIELTFYRLIRNLLIINWVVIGIGTKYLQQNIFFKFIQWGYLFAWIIAEFVIWNDWKNIIPYFFNSNLYL